MVDDATEDREVPDVVTSASIVKPTVQPTLRHLFMLDLPRMIFRLMGDSLDLRRSTHLQNTP